MKSVCMVLVIFGTLFVTDVKSEQYIVVGPAAPLFVVAGEDVILPCYIKPYTSAVDMRVEWFRLDQQNSLVHLYENHEDRNTEQILSYRGRTTLFQQELQKGNASLKLSKTHISDEGVYKCFIQSKSWYDDITVHVRVEAHGTHPLIIIEGFDHAGGLHLLCESNGWNPEPELQWLDSEGVSLISNVTETQKDTKGFIVKHTITVYNSDSKYHCRVKLKHHMLETQIIVSSKMLQIWTMTVIWITITVVINVAAAVLIATFVHRRRVHYRMRIKEEITKRRKHAVDVTLDPDTAHPNLILSDDGKQVRTGERKQDVPDNPERFNKCGNVLGRQGFSSGRFYYEVQVKGKTSWDLGVARESINRKWKVTISPQDGFWAVRLRKGNKYSACAGPSVSLSLKVKPQKVGVYVDYEEGLVCFYDVEYKTHIYSYTDQFFTEKLFPFFNPCTNVKARYSAPLIIC